MVIPQGRHGPACDSQCHFVSPWRTYVFLALAYALGLQGAWLYAAAWSFGLLCFSVALWRLGLWAFRSYGLFPALGGMLSAAGWSGVEAATSSRSSEEEKAGS